VRGMTAPPTTSVRGVNGAVSAAEQLATNAGIAILQAGGNAVDAAIATNAVMAAVAPHQCGMGGDLFALVHHDGETVALNASGRAGSGADADGLRGAGHTEMPLHHDIRVVTVPGCVDGWVTLHDRFGTTAAPSNWPRWRPACTPVRGSFGRASPAPCAPWARAVARRSTRVISDRV
jgi:gamma-glutamyltranspeptidase/glutathione hydrolase